MTLVSTIVTNIVTNQLKFAFEMENCCTLANFYRFSQGYIYTIDQIQSYGERP